ncbi:MAG: DUF3810 domain-containing protein [Clostridia bacterium]|nr:DUF3810 domain-containing protein [Clostridia bacterium]
MKKNSPQKKLSQAQPTPDAPRSPLTASELSALPPELRRRYRPVDPKYERFPWLCYVLYGLAAVCFVLYVIMMNSVAFADWFNTTVSAALRATCSALTSWIPFSLGEAVIWLAPLILFLVLRHAVRRRCDTWRTAMVYVGILMSVAATLFSVFVLNFAAGYRASPLEDKLELDRQKVSAEELYDTTVILIDCINRETAEISFTESGFSAMPYSLEEMNRHLDNAYDSFAEDHDFIIHTKSRVKPVLASEVMSYMHITGVYSFFTGEANINVNFPDYTIPYTAAHELSHQRGIAREDEANFAAFLVCIGSDDPYVRYSGYLNVYEYVASALYRADKELYYKAVAKLNQEVRSEMAAYNDFYDKYRESTASQVSGTINNSYLQSQGTPGTVSYGMVVDLTVAYYRSLPNS